MTHEEQNAHLFAAIGAALFAHQNQFDKRGDPIIYHILRVGALGRSFEEKIVGFLHDVIEDAPAVISVDEIRRNFGDEIANAVDAITQRPGEKYHKEYIPRLVKNPLATVVKLYDLADNMSPWRQDFDGHEKLLKKHQKAWEVVREAFEKQGEKLGVPS